MAINLWLGLYDAPGEWPWTYMFLVVLQLIYLIYPPGRSLGVDALARHEGTLANARRFFRWWRDKGDLKQGRNDRVLFRGRRSLWVVNLRFAMSAINPLTPRERT